MGFSYFGQSNVKCRIADFRYFRKVYGRLMVDVEDFVREEVLFL